MPTVLTPIDGIPPHPDNPKRPCPRCTFTGHRASLSAHIAKAHDGDVAAYLDAYTERGDHDACWPWAGTINTNGYGVLALDRRQDSVPRIVLGLRPGDGLDACHRCDNPPCVNPAHLYAGTRAQNQRDKAVRGRAARGERNGGGGKLTADDARAIYAADGTYAAIGGRYGITATMVGHIKMGRQWAHATGADATAHGR